MIRTSLQLADKFVTFVGKDFCVARISAVPPKTKARQHSLVAMSTLAKLPNIRCQTTFSAGA